jgi:peptidoglycan/LPS O-acetylase OafA/YrhL
MRALAIVLVVVYHVGFPLHGGFVGVDVFFVISGFVITGSVWRHVELDGKVDIRAFYVRRILRIIPALSVLLVGVALLNPLAGAFGSRQVAQETGIAAALSVSNVYLYLKPSLGYFDLDASFNPLLHTWSLGVEEQFYIVFPLLIAAALIAGRRRDRRRVVGLSLTVVGIASFLLSLVLLSAPLDRLGSRLRPDAAAFYLAPPRAWEFVAGALLALAPPMAVIRLGPWAARLGLALIGLSAVAYNDSTAFPGLAAVPPVLGTFLVLATPARSGSIVRRLLTMRPAQRIGNLSYSWYLWHWPLIVYARAAWPDSRLAASCAALAGLGAAVVSFRFVERPVRALDRKWAVAVLACGSIATLAVAVGSSPLANAIDRTPAVATYLHAHREHATGSSCDLDGETPRANALCDATGNEREAVLVGDSNAGHFSEPFFAVAHERGLVGRVEWRGNCPFADVIRYFRDADPSGCRDYYLTSMQELLARPPSLVVLASATESYVSSPNFQFGDPVSGERATSPAEKVGMWRRALTRTVTELRDAGIDVVVIHPVPVLITPGWKWSRCSALVVVIDSERCEPAGKEDRDGGYRNSVVEAERAATSATGTASVDPAPSLCGQQPCAPRVAGRWRYSDTNHITVEGSMRIARDLSAAVRSVLGDGHLTG